MEYPVGTHLSELFKLDFISKVDNENFSFCINMVTLLQHYEGCVCKIGPVPWPLLLAGNRESKLAGMDPFRRLKRLKVSLLDPFENMAKRTCSTCFLVYACPSIGGKEVNWSEISFWGVHCAFSNVHCAMCTFFLMQYSLTNKNSTVLHFYHKKVVTHRVWI